MFDLSKDLDKLEEAIKTYYYYIWEIEQGNFEFEEKRIMQHKKIAEILETEPENCTPVLHSLESDYNKWGVTPIGAAQKLAELKIHNLL